MRRGDLTVRAVGLALQEFDNVGRDAFLATYEFGKSRDYFLRSNGRSYDSKAIAAAAFQHIEGWGRALTNTELSGGIAHRQGAAAQLIDLGFLVTTDPDWSWDEHVLALDLFVTHRTKPLGKRSPEIPDLANLLRLANADERFERAPEFRNPAGVYMKLGNFLRFDPAYTARGKVGLSQGSKGEGEVWKFYAPEFATLAQDAAAIRAAIGNIRFEPDDPTPEYEAEEGGLVLRTHRQRERSPRLAREAKANAFRRFGRLSCEVCDFDFTKRYGSHGDGYIEAHHKKPVAQLIPGERTRLSDLALVCANCHRMLHRHQMRLGISDLRSLLRSDD